DDIAQRSVVGPAKTAHGAESPRVDLAILVEILTYMKGQDFANEEFGAGGPEVEDLREGALHAHRRLGKPRRPDPAACNRGQAEAFHFAYIGVKGLGAGVQLVQQAFVGNV